MTYSSSTPPAWRRLGPTAALALSLSVAGAAPIVAQDSARASTATPDSAQAAAKKAACAQIKAYAKQLTTDSIKARWKAGTLLKTTASGQTQVELPGAVITAATVPDSLRTAVTTAGPSCNANMDPQAAMQLVMAQMNAPRPLLGVQLKTLAAKDTAGLGLTSLPALLVQAVTARSGAAEAGVVKGDIIVAIDGQPATGAEQLMVRSATWKDGQVVSLDLVRQGGKREKVDVTVKMK